MRQAIELVTGYETALSIATSALKQGSDKPWPVARLLQSFLQHVRRLASACVSRHILLAQLAFIPKAWQQSDPDVPQITHTFCPRQPQANPGKRKGRKGNAKHAGSGTGAITGATRKGSQNFASLR